MPKTPFSERHGYTRPDAEITVRHDAPEDLRGVVPEFAYAAGLPANRLRSLVCRVLQTREDSNNWSEGNVVGEVQGLLDTCEWFDVYDIIEAIYDALERSHRSPRNQDPAEEGRDKFENDLNRYFRRRGIGWQLMDGEICVRGPEAFEEAVRDAIDSLEASGRQTARQEIEEALRDLSRRPEPDLTGAVQHAMAALECVARDVTGDPTSTLGECIKRHPGMIPPPLDQAIDKAWGFASERGRHLREGREPDDEDAELIVGLASVVSSYLVRKHSR